MQYKPVVGEGVGDIVSDIVGDTAGDIVDDAVSEGMNMVKAKYLRKGNNYTLC